jgi:hypothetical protein
MGRSGSPTAHDHKAIVNPETGKVFSVVSKNYKLMRHEQAIDQVNKALDKNSDLGEYETSPELYNDGAGCECHTVFMKRQLK